MFPMVLVHGAAYPLHVLCRKSRSKTSSLVSLCRCHNALESSHTILREEQRFRRVNVASGASPAVGRYSRRVLTAQDCREFSIIAAYCGKTHVEADCKMQTTNPPEYCRHQDMRAHRQEME